MGRNLDRRIEALEKQFSTPDAPTWQENHDATTRGIYHKLLLIARDEEGLDLGPEELAFLEAYGEEEQEADANTKRRWRAANPSGPVDPQRREKMIETLRRIAQEPLRRNALRPGRAADL